MAEAPLLNLQQITKSYRGGAGEQQVLADITLSVRKGEFVSVVGPSGCGKSTIFHIVGGVVPPTSGRVFLDGEDKTGARGQISYMPQQAALFPWRTIEDNVILAQELSGVKKREARAKARDWLARVGLEGYEKAYPATLSGGMQQRVSFLRALLSPQELICLDEPFSALDALTRQDMQRWLLTIWEQYRRSVLFITHNIEEALLLSDTVYLLSNKPTKVLRQIEVPFARPRSDKLISEPLFVSLRQEIYEQMKEEQSLQRGR
ncbi:ABC transporter ATP-binding protein [Paenibacillus senegalensis]|uniref:ABC transporter ATP-binding protein n=1 Tax=Paenibacillus senegalensis TaxID=1465766 RepID=UPI00031631E8|nr:ABC transporter ATP-binding protein [Paenibacillus senegalensis]